MTTTDSGEEAAGGRENQQRKERGGAADVDRSKGAGTDESGAPFGNSGEDSADSKKGSSLD